MGKLRPENLQKVSTKSASAVLAYLNMLPVGCYDDISAAPQVKQEGGYELDSSVRTALIRRRNQAGQFESLADLLNVDGFGPKDLRLIIARLQDTTRYGNLLYPVWGGAESEREFFSLLENASHHIHISTYIIGGRVGLRLADVLARKKREGIEVRVMFCASGFVVSGSPSGTGFVSRFSELRSYLLNDMYLRKRIVKQLKNAGVELINSSPIGRHWKRLSLRERGIKNALEYQQWAIHRGIPDEWLEEQQRIDNQCSVEFANVDHRKMVIVDGRRAFIGSQNIADSYFFPNELSIDPVVNRKHWQWHDNSAILEGGAVHKLTRLFARRWQLSGGDMFDWQGAEYIPPSEWVGDAAVTIESSIPGQITMPLKKNLPRLLKSMCGANLTPLFEGHNPIRDRLLVMPEVAQFNFIAEHCYPSDAALLERWTKAAETLPEFTMVVPMHYDTVVMGSECNRHYSEMIAGGVDLQGYGRAIMHSKIMVADGYYSALGSYNLNQRSGRADLEVEFFIQSSSFGALVRQRILDDLDECEKIEPGLLARFRSRRSLPVFDALMRYFLL